MQPVFDHEGCKDVNFTSPLFFEQFDGDQLLGMIDSINNIGDILNAEEIGQLSGETSTLNLTEDRVLNLFSKGLKEMFSDDSDAGDKQVEEAGDTFVTP